MATTITTTTGRKIMRFRLVFVVIVISLLAVFIVFSWNNYQYDQSLSDEHGIERAILYYYVETGELPSTLQDLVTRRICLQESSGAWIVQLRKGVYRGDSNVEMVRISHPDWFDIMSRKDAADLQRSGIVTSIGREIVVPSGLAKYPGFATTCLNLSKRIGVAIDDLRNSRN